MINQRSKSRSCLEETTHQRRISLFFNDAPTSPEDTQTDGEDIGMTDLDTTNPMVQSSHILGQKSGIDRTCNGIRILNGLCTIAYICATPGLIITFHELYTSTQECYVPLFSYLVDEMIRILLTLMGSIEAASCFFVIYFCSLQFRMEVKNRLPCSKN